MQPGLMNTTIFPGQKMESCCGGSCESFEKKLPEKQSNKKENTNEGACNPFKPCQCCTGFNADFALIAFAQVVLFTKSQANIDDKIPPQITIDFWQPPKIV